MKIALCVLSVLITVFYTSSYNTGWAIHDDDSISRGGAWSTDDVNVERPGDAVPKTDEPGKIIEISPEESEEKDSVPVSRDDDKDAPEYNDPDNNNGIKE
jgi:hypothetical protein